MTKSRMVAIALTAGAVAVSLAALKWHGAPWLVIALAWIVACAGWLVTTRHPIFVTIALLLAPIAGLEAWFWAQQNSTAASLAQFSRPDYRYPHPVLGPSPSPDMRVEARYVFDGHEDIVATYGVDTLGNRLSMPESSIPSAPSACVLFFGGSFAFGQGIDDSDTLPYRFGTLAGPGVRPINLSFPGRGATQMLAMLETGLIDEHIDCQPTHVIYIAIPHHVLRAQGSGFYRFGPDYRLEGGRAVHHGLRDATQSAGLMEESPLLYQLTKSRILKALRSRDLLVTPDLDLYLAIVRQSAEETSRRFPNATFEIVLWDDVPAGDTPLYQDVRSGLQGLGYELHVVPELMPEFVQDRGAFAIRPGADAHPNPRANEILATRLLPRILGDASN